MPRVRICELSEAHKDAFLQAMRRSRALHQPWVNAPTTSAEFDEFFKRSQQPQNHCYLITDASNALLGVFNISEIVRGNFQNAYLGFYSVSDHAGKGYMRAGMKLVLRKIFQTLKLHRIEANIQPQNKRSISLVKKSSFHYEGYSPRYLKINEKWCDHERWAMTAEDWLLIQSSVKKSTDNSLRLS